MFTRRIRALSTHGARQGHQEGYKYLETASLTLWGDSSLTLCAKSYLNILVAAL
jgi:hypothetical protein